MLEVMLPEFTSAPMLDFARPDAEAGMREALERVRAKFGTTYPLVIGGKRITTKETFQSKNPANPSEIVGNFSKATVEHVNDAVAAADKAFQGWAWTPPQTRAEVLLRAAEILRRRRHEMNATMVLEVGKNWSEADGDTAEAIDFLEFYAREMIRWGGPHPLVQNPGEKNELVYISLGVGVVIPPWNFPCAIAMGMTAATIVTGNSAILKPSSDSPLTAWKVFEVLEEAGVPAGVLNFLPGPGGTIGDALVEHPRVRFVAFTGSMEVGIGINERAAKVPKGQIWLKRAILEMGGKDFMILDEDADLDSGVAGVYAAAFGFQGQKCSACSRAIVHEKLYDEFVEKLRVRTDAMTIGATEKKENYLGPVASASAEKKILEYMEIGKGEGRLITGGGKHSGPGYFLKPTIFADVKPRARIAQEEIFGPVLAVIKARSFEEEIEIANGTIYGLTGSYYSRDRAKVAEAKRRLHVGNLYINRKCTGALVGIHPFGGFNMSGTDSKAGGRDYLGLFLQGKSIAEYVG
ncbi:MAG TPA: L-glutamate gamma-semialdehyde dehydrogenase [Candidatus Dormibacteraeota bacterium]|nr:L-glutamate gamma-semialdehyde dehydrogenase [Candidatus Dormibacteraeota bacterium]